LEKIPREPRGFRAVGAVPDGDKEGIVRFRRLRGDLLLEQSVRALGRANVGAGNGAAEPQLFREWNGESNADVSLSARPRSKESRPLVQRSRDRRVWNRNRLDPSRPGFPDLRAGNLELRIAGERVGYRIGAAKAQRI
jgi:hypothetical protein